MNSKEQGEWSWGIMGHLQPSGSGVLDVHCERPTERGRSNERRWPYDAVLSWTFSSWFNFTFTGPTFILGDKNVSMVLLWSLICFRQINITQNKVAMYLPLELRSGTEIVEILSCCWVQYCGTWPCVFIHSIAVICSLIQQLIFIPSLYIIAF